MKLVHAMCVVIGVFLAAPAVAENVKVSSPLPISRTGTLAGVVVKASGQVVAGAPVQLVDTHGRVTAKTVTGKNGSFRFKGVPAGQYVIYSYYEGAPGKTECSVSPGLTSFYKVVIIG